MASNFGNKLISYSGYQVEYFNIHDQSWQAHLGFADVLVNELSPKVIVEIGSSSCNSYFALCQAVYQHKIEANCFGFGSWKGRDGRFKAEVMAYNKQTYGSFSLLRASTSHDALKGFEDESIDILNIVGITNNQEMKETFAEWMPKVRAGGVVLIHNITMPEGEKGVTNFWDNLVDSSAEDETMICINSNGLGVWRKSGGKRLRSTVLKLLFGESCEDRVLAERFIAMLTDRALCYHYIHYLKSNR